MCSLNWCKLIVHWRTQSHSFLALLLLMDWLKHFGDWTVVDWAYKQVNWWVFLYCRFASVAMKSACNYMRRSSWLIHHTFTYMGVYISWFTILCFKTYSSIVIWTFMLLQVKRKWIQCKATGCSRCKYSSPGWNVCNSAWYVTGILTLISFLYLYTDMLFCWKWTCSSSRPRVWSFRMLSYL
jgi:hypothetical protein